MITILRPLSTSELLDRTFYLYRKYFLVFVGITAIPQLAVLALRLLGAAMTGGRMSSRFSLLPIVAALVSYVAVQVAQAATVMAVSNSHLDRPVAIASAFSAAKGSMLRVILISLAVAIAAGVALIFLIIPGVYLWLTWSLAIPVTVLEGGGLNASTARSKQLSRDSRGRILLIYVLLFVLAIIVSVIFEAPLGIIAALVGRANPLPILALLQAANAIGTFISTSLVGPLATIALTLIYYDQRVRKEGFDLELMMANVQPGIQSAAVATN